MTGSQIQQDQALKLTSLSLENAALLLSKSTGKTVSVETLKADIEAGCPTNPDGTFNVMHYASWLVKEVATRGD